MYRDKRDAVMIKNPSGEAGSTTRFQHEKVYVEER